WSGSGTSTPLGTYTNEPPDQTAPLSAENLLSSAGTTVPKYFLKISGYAFRPWSVPMNTTPILESSSLTEWYTTSESYWAPTPARNLRSASGIPSRSNVALICSGTSSQDFSSRSDGLR